MEILLLHLLNNRQKQDLKNLIRLCEAEEPTYLMFDLSDQEGNYLLAYDKNRLVSALALYRAGSDFECVAATLPQRRREGLFQSLLSQAEEHFPDVDFHFLTDGKSSSALCVLSHFQCPVLCEEYLMELKREDFKERLSILSPPSHITVSMTAQENTKIFHAFFPAENTGENLCAGTCCCSVFEKEFCIWGVEVKEPFRRKGIGKALILSALSSMFGLEPAPCSACNSAVLHVEGGNFPAISLYESIGFSVVRKIFYYLY